MTIEKLKHTRAFLAGVKPNEYSSYDITLTHEALCTIKATLEAVIEQATPDDDGLCKCPFCGNSPEYSFNPEDEFGSWDTHVVGCEKPNEHVVFVLAGTKEAAIKAWNERTLITAIEEKLK